MTKAIQGLIHRIGGFALLHLPGTTDKVQVGHKLFQVLHSTPNAIVLHTHIHVVLLDDIPAITVST